MKKRNYSEDEDDDDFSSSDDEYSQSGGDDDTDGESDELDSDSTTIDVDPDEKESDSNGDDKFDPINEGDESEDEDDEEYDEDNNEDTDEEIAEDETTEYADEDLDNENPGEFKSCYLKNLNKDKNFVVLDEDDSNLYSKMEYKRIDDKDRISDNILTYYEMVRIIGTRAQQFNLGAKPLVKGLDGLHTAQMAFVELMAKMTPFIIRRHLPGKTYEEWKIDELEIAHTIRDDFYVPKNFDWSTIRKDS
jgi:DNA-directed RNA polymerase subunit K/omega